MSITEQIRLNYPLPIAKRYEAMLLENEPRLRVRQLVTLFEEIVRYLCLAGLASYIHYNLSSSDVEKGRAELGKPSLGHWVNLLQSIAQTLHPNKMYSFVPELDRGHRKDPIFDASKILAETAGVSTKFKRINLTGFMGKVVEFRNKKIGHGSLSLREAKDVLVPLESAINQMLGEISIFQQQHLIYISRVEWQSPQYTCYGTNMNSGTSFSPFTLKRDEKITHDRVYLYSTTGDDPISLYPFFVFDKDAKLLYMYNELSANQELILRCPYETANAEVKKLESDDATTVLGKITPVKDFDPNVIDGKENSDKAKEESLIVKRIKNNLADSWLTESQRAVWTELNDKYIKQPPFYVVNIYGATGTGKTFLGWLLQKQGAIYSDAQNLNWRSWRGAPLVVLDGHSSSRRAVRSLRDYIQKWNIGQVIILTRHQAQDDIPRLRLEVTEKDIQIVKANLYRELDIIIPEGNYRNLVECCKYLEAKNSEC